MSPAAQCNKGEMSLSAKGVLVEEPLAVIQVNNQVTLRVLNCVLQPYPSANHVPA
jgi:hypothetical protein